jgi:glycosyltransferase involved in cell wall biosynthesis
MIDIIIPAYNAHNTIIKTLFSIANQTVKDQINVIIINDNSYNDYSEAITRFKDLLNIKEIILQKNGGPGVARQIGIDNSNSPFIMFIDADDILIDALAVDGILKFMDSDPNCAMVSANFLEQVSFGELVSHENDLVWMFGKIYRRSILNDRNIKFSTLRSNEDLEFNTKFKLSLKDKEYIYYLRDKFIYLWQFKEDSITRKNNFEYSYHTGLIGSIDAKMNVFKSINLLKDPKTEKEIQMLVVDLFNEYNQLLVERPNEKKWIENVENKISEFWKKFGKKEFEKISSEEKIFIYSQAMTRISVIPKITFDNFIKIIDEIKA